MGVERAEMKRGEESVNATYDQQVWLTLSLGEFVTKDATDQLMQGANPAVDFPPTVDDSSCSISNPAF